MLLVWEMILSQMTEKKSRILFISLFPVLIKLGSSGEYVTKDAISKMDKADKKIPNNSINLFMKKSLIFVI